MTWTYEPRGEYLKYLILEGNVPIAEVGKDKYARLIATAPDLLRALDNLIREVDKARKVYISNSLEEAYEKAYAVALKALGK